ncbi:hypothetical protein Tco_0955761 [Tanacetum coccineum]|uniref:Uncharacterized protein n=1 Tax=Tanacetum coccineum TaxID=301880 RepID=A0ABQ5E867_9ASTR
MPNSILVLVPEIVTKWLAMGKYAQWQSCFMRYVDTKPNGVETFSNISPENKAHYDAEKEAIHLLLTRTGDEIYSNVDACKTAHDIWIAIERLQQGESLNKQDVKTSLFQEFGRFTSRDRESIKSYYSRYFVRNGGNQRAKGLHLSTRKRCCVRTSWSSVPITAVQANWPENTYEEIDEQELEAH